MKSRILEIAELVEYLADYRNTDTKKANVVKLAISDNLITIDEGIDLIVEYTKLYKKNK